MANNDNNDLFELDCEERFDYFLNTVDAEKEIWVLVNDSREFLKIFAEDEGFEYVPVWPSSALAQAYVQEEAGLTPKSIALPEFMQKWVAGLTRDGLDVGVFPAPDGSVWLLKPDELKRELQSL